MDSRTHVDGGMKRYFLLALAIALLGIGGAALFLGRNDFLLRSVGLAAILGSVPIARISGFHPRFLPDRSAAVISRPGPILWLVGLVLAATVGVTYYALYRDALGGGNEVLPVYLFAAAAVVCTAFWGYLVSRLL
jgi:hypothetical protein